MTWTPPAGMDPADQKDLEELVAYYRGIVARHVADFETQPTGRDLLRARMRLGYSRGEATATLTRMDQHAVRLPPEAA